MKMAPSPKGVERALAGLRGLDFSGLAGGNQATDHIGIKRVADTVSAERLVWTILDL